MGRLLAGITLGVALTLLSGGTLYAADCEFRLGFKTLRDLIGHEIVGECLENEHYNEIGDSNQQTTGGLMAWRKADNRTVFTDGYRTWIAGPNGLVQRLNTERFEWEADHIHTQPPAPSPTPSPAPKATIDSRLQPVLDFLESTGGDHIVDTFEETRANLIYANSSDPAQYRPSTNTIIFDDGMSSQPIEVRAYMLAHEIWHAVQPWMERGRECYVGEFRAEMYATFWWMHKYKDAGHPNSAGNDYISYFNLLAWLMASDIKNGTSSFREQVYKAYADVCGPVAAMPSFDYAAVERLYRFTEVIAKRALAAKLGVNPNGSVAGMAVRAYARHIDALPLVYVMHVWSVGGTGASHPLFDVDSFVKAYFDDPRVYLQIADTWLTDYLADPCSASQEAREWVIANEERNPGTLRAYIRAAVTPDAIVEYVVRGIYEGAEAAFYDNPNLYRCAVE